MLKSDAAYQQAALFRISQSNAEKMHLFIHSILNSNFDYLVFFLCFFLPFLLELLNGDMHEVRFHIVTCLSMRCFAINYPGHMTLSYQWGALLSITLVIWHWPLIIAQYWIPIGSPFHGLKLPGDFPDLVICDVPWCAGTLIRDLVHQSYKDQHDSKIWKIHSSNTFWKHANGRVLNKKLVK